MASNPEFVMSSELLPELLLVSAQSLFDASAASGYVVF